MLQRMRDLKVQFEQRHARRQRQGRDRGRGRPDRQGSRRASSPTTEFNGKTLFTQRHVHLPGRRQRQRDHLASRQIDLSRRHATGGLSRSSPRLRRGTASRRSPHSAAWPTSTIDARSRTSPRPRGQFGAVQNRLEHRLNNLATYQENLTASESRIRDVDMAAEMTKFTKLNILQQAGTSMLAQANQAPAGRPLAAALVRVRCVLSSPVLGRGRHATATEGRAQSALTSVPRHRVIRQGRMESPVPDHKEFGSWAFASRTTSRRSTRTVS